MKLALKNDSLETDMEEQLRRQEQVNQIANAAVGYSEKIFEKMLEPILNILDKEKDLVALREKLEDKEQLKKLYEDMESPELTDLLTQAMYMSHLIGRSN